MNRRDALRRIGTATGGLVLSPVLPVQAMFQNDPDFQGTRALRAIEGLKGEDPAQAEVRVERGGPRLYLNGEEIYPFLALSRKLIPTTPVFQDAGINLLQPFLGMQAGWKGPDEYDWTTLDAFLGRLLELNPNALFLPRVHLATPEWWKKAHPEAMIEYGRSYPEERYDSEKRLSEGGHHWGSGNELWEASFASEEWRRDTADMLRAYVRHVEESPLSSRVFGYHFSTGLTGEWHYYGPTFFPDYSAPMKERCGSIPPPDARRTTTAGLLRDPAKEREVIEYYRCQHEATADAVLDMAQALKEASARKVVVGTFFTYLLEVVRIQEIGHLAPKQVLESPDIDFIGCPYTYQGTNMEDKADWESGVVDGAGNVLGRARGVAGDGGPRVLPESLRRHGKLYMSEIDPSTYLADEPLGVGGSGSTTKEGTLKILRRDLGQVFAGGIGGWLYDFGTGEAHSDAYGSSEAERGWFADEPIIETIRRFVELGEQRPRLHIGSVARMATLYDAKSFFATQHWKAAKPWPNYAISVSDFFNHWFLNAQARSLHRVGTPVDLLYRFDLTTEDLERYRLLFVPNAFFLTADEVTALRDRLRGSGVTVVWVYAPGFVTPERLDLDQMERLTGFQHKRIDTPGPMMIRTQMRGKGIPERFGVDEVHHPRFSVTDSEAEVLGMWTDRDEVAFARTEREGWTSVYAGTAPLPVAVLRRLAREAEVPLWSSGPDVIYGTEDAAMVVATEEGPRTLDFHKPMQPVEGGTPQQTHELFMDFGEVRLFTAGAE